MSTKPGYKTSEFWLSLAAALLSAAFASGAFATDGWVAKVLGVAALVLTSLGYTVSRTLVKRADAAAGPAIELGVVAQLPPPGQGG